jgi:hypothetical protein
VDGALEAQAHADQIYQAIAQHGPLVLLPRPQDVADWWHETKEQCLNRLGPCIQDKAKEARAELNRYRRMSWEEKQYELGKLGFQAVEETVINAVLPGGGAAGRAGVKVAEQAAEKQFVKAAERKLEMAAATHAGEAAAQKAAGEALEQGLAKAELSKEAQKSIQSLEKRITEHEKKLADFKESPTVRPGMENMPQDMITKQQQARIKHLEHEIKTFRENIEKIRRGEL